MNYLVFDTPSYYDDINFNVNKSTTLLPTSIVIIRIAAAIAFAALAVAYSVPVLPLVILSSVFIGWTIYKQIISKDPMMEAFYKMLGGKEEFEKLPVLDLHPNQDERICQTIDKIDWGTLAHPISRSKTLDGRNIIIIKKYNECINDNDHTVTWTRESLFIFIEKMGPLDLFYSNFQFPFLTRLGLLFGETIMHPFSSNSTRETLRSGGNSNNPTRIARWQERFVESSLTAEFANIITNHLQGIN